ncbi:MAG: SAM-dependent methyltransferase, partial [Clostridiaceae bacterium]|nr:SAM-dependent methyltransferase [Clostridiaceae bacterium]
MIVHENERLDELNNLKIIQNPKGFCYGTDAVILANFSKAMRG